MKNSNADFVIGSKRHPHSKLIYPKLRRNLSIGYNIIVKLLFRLSISDTQTGIKLAKRKVLQKVIQNVGVNRYAFDLELLLNANNLGFKIVEAPVTLDFHYKFGRIRFRDVLKMIRDTATIFYRQSIVYHNGKSYHHQNVTDL